MPRKAASGDGSIRKRPSGLWECRITVGTNPGTGRPLRRSIYGHSQAEVRQKKTELLRSLDTGSYLLPTKITLEAWSQQWLRNSVEPTLKSLTCDAYRSALRSHILPALGKMKLQEITTAHIQKMVADMTRAGKSAKTTRNTHAVLSRCLVSAVKSGLILNNPCQAVELPKKAQREIHPLKDSEIPVFLRLIEEDEMGNAFAVMLLCGLREGEALGLSWDCVDFESRKITICQQLVHGKEAGSQYKIQTSTKGGRSRTIDAPDLAFDYLRKEKARQAENHLKALQLGEAWENSANLVFTNHVGQCFKLRTFHKHFKKIAESLGRPDLTPHSLRHTCATAALASGADVKSVQTLLGHAHASITLDVYAHATEDMKRDTANRMQAYFESLEKQA